MSEKASGRKVIASLLDSEDGLGEFHRLGLNRDFFHGSEAELFDYVKEFAFKYGDVPSRDTVKSYFGKNDPQLGELPDTKEPPGFYYDQIKTRYFHRLAVDTLEDAREDLNGKDPYSALERMQAAVMQAKVKQNDNQIINFTDEAHDIIRQEYIKKFQEGDQYGIQMGWPTVDDMSGGLGGGDVVVIVGRPASGKTYKMLHSAHHAWYTQKKNVLMVSMEMKPLPLMQRIAAMHSHVSVSNLKQAELSSKSLQGMFDGLKTIQGEESDFWIVDGSLTATVEDIAMMARQLKPDAVYVDGAYLIQHPNQKAARWEKVADTTEGLKNYVAEDLDVPLISSYQFNRDAAKKKNTSEVGLEDIAYSDSIGQIASLVLGLFEDETVETLMQKRVDILKGRNGETGHFNINWIFDLYPFMDFTEKFEEFSTPTQMGYI